MWAHISFSQHCGAKIYQLILLIMLAPMTMTIPDIIPPGDIKPSVASDPTPLGSRARISESGPRETILGEKKRAASLAPPAS